MNIFDKYGRFAGSLEPPTDNSFLGGIIVSLLMLFVNLFFLAPIDGFREIRDGNKKGFFYFIPLIVLTIVILSGIK